MRLLIAIPAYNEATRITEVVRECLKMSADVVVIDDGSTDSTGQYAAQAGARVLRHAINRDLGSAIQTAFAYARESDADVLVTIDGDGQFSPADIPRLIAPIVAGDADVVFGSRFLQKNQVPLKRRLGNIAANMVTWLLFGARVSDTQSGFRVFKRNAFETMMLHTNGMEISSEIVQEVWNRKLRIAEVPVTVTYDVYTMAKGQGFRRGLRTLGALILRRIS